MTTSKRTSRSTGGAQDGNSSLAHASVPTSSSKSRTRRAKSPPAAPQRQDRHASIAEAAYFRSQNRGFVPGYELEDWLAAEEEVDQRLRGQGRVS